jgi:hypothetical protein
MHKLEEEMHNSWDNAQKQRVNAQNRGSNAPNQKMNAQNRVSNAQPVFLAQKALGLFIQVLFHFGQSF